MPPLFIIGYMASGKTTFGRALAKATGREFIDLDFYISQRFRASIPEIFATKGEAEFRRIESAMLREAGEFDDVIVSCGGGTPCHDDNMAYMNSRGTTLLLTAGIERLMERLMLHPERRPLVAGKSEAEVRQFVERSLQQRQQWYSQAQIAFSGETLENSREISVSVQEFLKLHPEV